MSATCVTDPATTVTEAPPDCAGDPPVGVNVACAVTSPASLPVTGNVATPDDTTMLVAVAPTVGRPTACPAPAPEFDCPNATVPVAVGTVLPFESSNVARRSREPPADRSVASTTSLSLTGSSTSDATAPGVIANCGLVVAVRVVPLSVAVAVRTLFDPALSMLSGVSEPVPKDARPAVAVIVFVPESVPVPPVRVSAIDSEASAPVVTVLPIASSMVTTGCRANADPAAVDAVGCVVNASTAAAPAPVGVIVAVVDASPGEVNISV